eukprot:TRINITY_DN14672_c0_g1_i3.p1 TRINITY_DN14672_c0_g1~~TRINITY_DN14672_c0_g1_i3.p1  ORF type:complete len:118 (-),score=10.37 TRINITY_DN14672_c0_g1_i3:6-359(-)
MNFLRFLSLSCLAVFLLLLTFSPNQSRAEVAEVAATQPVLVPNDIPAGRKDLIPHRMLLTYKQCCDNCQKKQQVCKKSRDSCNKTCKNNNDRNKCSSKYKQCKRTVDSCYNKCHKDD